jgi:hypothetical protein
MNNPTRPQIEMALHPKRCAAKAPIAPSLLRAMVWGSGAAVVLSALLACGLPRRRKQGKRE